jgi:hypothetical protein
MQEIKMVWVASDDITFRSNFVKISHLVKKLTRQTTQHCEQPILLLFPLKKGKQVGKQLWHYFILKQLKNKLQNDHKHDVPKCNVAMEAMQILNEAAVELGIFHHSV